VNAAGRRGDSGAAVLVVGYDGSDTAAEAVRWAAGQPRARLIVLDVAGGASDVWEADARARLEALWMTEDLLVDAEVDLQVAHGDVARALCEAARDADAAAIVVGRHRSGLLAADTVRRVIAPADRPVVVIPATGA
jgi:nucleotide-binding universal stress UspA family protein